MFCSIFIITPFLQLMLNLWLLLL